MCKLTIRRPALGPYTEGPRRDHRLVTGATPTLAYNWPGPVPGHLGVSNGFRRRAGLRRRYPIYLLAPLDLPPAVSNQRALIGTCAAINNRWLQNKIVLSPRL